MMLKYAKVINEETKQCQVGTGTNDTFYASIGMTPMDVEQGYDGAWYLKGYAPTAPAPTAQDIINQYDTAIEQWLDSTVQQRNYKNVESCISYKGDANPKYAREAEAVKAWRSAVYTQAEVLIAQYIGGDIADVPPIETIIAELPQLDWNDPVEPVPEEVSDGATDE